MRYRECPHFERRAWPYPTVDRGLSNRETRNAVLPISQEGHEGGSRRAPFETGRLAVSCVELPREPLGVASCADRAVEIEGFPERPVGRRRVADRGSQATTQLQDSRRQRATLDRRDQVLSAFESGLDLGAGADTIRRQQGRRQSELRKRLVVEAATGIPQIDAFARRGYGLGRFAKCQVRLRESGQHQGKERPHHAAIPSDGGTYAESFPSGGRLSFDQIRQPESCVRGHPGRLVVELLRNFEAT